MYFLLLHSIISGTKYFTMASCCSGDVPQISLKNLAFTVFFEKVICKATPDTVDIIRDIIDQQRPVR